MKYNAMQRAFHRARTGKELPTGKASTTVRMAAANRSKAKLRIDRDYALAKHNHLKQELERLVLKETAAIKAGATPADAGWEAPTYPSPKMTPVQRIRSQFHHTMKEFRHTVNVINQLNRRIGT